MTYYKSAGVYHDWQRCPRAHATGDRIETTQDVDGLDACPACVDTEETEFDTGGDDADICTVELSTGGKCGRERPCAYHD